MAVTVRQKRSRIDRKETQPPDIAHDPSRRTVCWSRKGLNIPTMSANGEATMSLLMTYPAGISPSRMMIIRYTANGSIAATTYLSKETTQTTNRAAVSTLTRGSSRCTTVVPVASLSR